MRPTRFFPLPTVAAALLVAALGSPVGAVVISTASDESSLRAPGNDPGWNNVGSVATASGVYLGNRWVITANHVSNGPLRLSDGREFAVSIGSPLRLDNPQGTFGRPDLRMFRLAQDPGLPALELASSLAGIDSQVTMIGAGLDRAATVTGWQTFGPAWTEVPLPVATVNGYSLLSTSQMRWGFNRVSSGLGFGTNQTFSFSTTFNSGAFFEAQATPGDSGGGVFSFRDGSWELTGIMTSTQTLGGQPDGTVVFGNQTIIADLSSYREQIMELVERAEPLWQNQTNHFDVSGSGRVTQHDLAIVVNELLSTGARQLDGAPVDSDWPVDVNGDYRLSISDAQQIINGILSGTVNPSLSPSAGANFVPEPSGAALAVTGLLLALLGRFLSRRRIRA